MSYKKIANIIEKIYEKTTENTVQWEETETSDIFQVSFSNYALRISKKQLSQDIDDCDFMIEVINTLGETIEYVKDEDISSLIENSYYKMKLTYESARKKALGVDDALDSILNELNDGIPF